QRRRQGDRFANRVHTGHVLHTRRVQSLVLDRLSSYPTIADAVGLRTCIGYSTPSQPGRLFPRRAWMNIDKTDATLEKYELTLETAGTSPLPMPRRFTFDTP